MIKGIQAFDACWMNLRSLYPTGRDNNLMIAQAMGQVTDHYGTVEEIEQTLPTNLKDLFRKLVHAYFHGYAVNSTPTVNSDRAAIADQLQPIKSPQNFQTNGDTDQVDDSGKPALADNASKHPHRRIHNFCLTNPNEAETLIIEFPFDE